QEADAALPVLLQQRQANGQRCRQQRRLEEIEDREQLMDAADGGRDVDRDAHEQRIPCADGRSRNGRGYGGRRGSCAASCLDDASARSLVCAGHSVGVTADSRVSLAGVSRGVRPHPLTTDPLTHPADYAAELASITRQHGTTVLLPMTDASLEAVLEHRSVLPAG